MLFPVSHEGYNQQLLISGALLQCKASGCACARDFADHAATAVYRVHAPAPHLQWTAPSSTLHAVVSASIRSVPAVFAVRIGEKRGFNDEMRRAPSQTPESRNNSYSSPLWPERMFKVCVEFALCILFAIWLRCRPTPLSAPKNATNFPTRDVSRKASCRNSQFRTRCCDALTN